MSRLRPDKLHATLSPEIAASGPIEPRRYTLTHSDVTGDLYLTIGDDYDRAQISGWYTRIMRDEVLAEWIVSAEGASLHVYCHVSGGLVLGSARWRYAIFQRELPLVLEAFRHGDKALFTVHPELDQAPVLVHFVSTVRCYHRIESWGTPANYRLE